MKKLLRIITPIFLVALVVFLALALWRYDVQARARILPGVTVRGINVGGLTVPEATDVLRRELPAPEMLGVTLRAEGQMWQMTWATVDQHYDIDATVQAAYAVGHDAQGPALWWASWQDHAAVIDPIVIPADPTKVRVYQERIAEMLYTAPLDAQLDLEADNIIAIPGRPGQRLDVDANLPRILAALAEGAESVDLELTALAALRPEPEPARTQMEAWLSQPFILNVQDVLTGEEPDGYRAEFILSPPQLATWFMLAESMEYINVYINADPALAWLAEVSAQLGKERLLDIDETFKNMLHALYMDEHQAQARVRHPTYTYTVQAGDSLSLIAFEHQLPTWQLIKANPDIEPGAINVGQIITLPSLDVLFPHPLSPDKRIEVNLWTQKMTAFEYDAPVYTFTVSSGISKTPTLAGQYQILFKDEAAFARRWELDMPYFMGIYEEDDGFFNGIHELPITSYGVRLSPYVLGAPASFGCIILDEGDAETLFNWTEIGTLVRITGFAPDTPTWAETLADLAPLEEEP